jgi:hypothetical protein
MAARARHSFCWQLRLRSYERAGSSRSASGFGGCRDLLQNLRGKLFVPGLHGHVAERDDPHEPFVAVHDGQAPDLRSLHDLGRLADCLVVEATAPQALAPIAAGTARPM